ncbi:MAG: hypothetical protein KKA90_05095 [Nanoarchaeota archaeon]|nr:hypothetical protein [Nanoarchaeota archaeon]
MEIQKEEQDNELSGLAALAALVEKGIDNKRPEEEIPDPSFILRLQDDDEPEPEPDEPDEGPDTEPDEKPDREPEPDAPEEEPDEPDGDAEEQEEQLAETLQPLIKALEKRLMTIEEKFEQHHTRHVPKPPTPHPFSHDAETRLSRLTVELVRLATDADKANKRILAALDNVRHVYHTLDRHERRMESLEKRHQDVKDLARHVSHLDERFLTFSQERSRPQIVEHQEPVHEMPVPSPVEQPTPRTPFNVNATDLERSYKKGLIPYEWYIAAKRRISPQAYLSTQR